MSIPLLVVLVLVWIAVVVFCRQYRIWILYYLVGTVGLAYLSVYIISKVLVFEPILAHSVAIAVHDSLNFINIPTEIFQNAPGVLLVLVVTQKVGWTVLQIGVESSGLLEICVLVSLVVFYPLWTWRKKVMMGLIGIAFTWFANVARMLLIALMLHFFGKEALVIAHTFIGKAFFFLVTIGIYWFLVTANSLPDIKRKILARPGSE
jgi:exosortase family protein XrtG